MGENRKYIYIVNNLKTTVFDSQFLGWIREYEKEGVYFDIIFIPTGVKSYLRDFKFSIKKSRAVSKLIKGKVFHSLPSSLGSRMGFVALFVLLFKSILLKRQIVIQVSSPSWSKSIHLLKKLYPNIYVIYDAIGASAEKYLLSNKPQSVKTRIYNKILKAQLEQAQLADKIIVVSNKLKQYLLTKDSSIDEKKIEVVSCSADDSAFYFDKKLRNSIRKKLSLEEKKVFIYCGALDKVWQIPDFIFSVYSLIQKYYKNSFFIILTPNSDMVNKYVEKYEIDKTSIWTNYVRNDEINQYLCAADMAFLFREDVPTNNVAAPTKFSEYTLSGLPTMISENVGDFSEFVEEKNIGVVINNDLEKIERQIKEMNINSFDRLKIAKLGKENFAKNVYFDRAVNIYKEITSN